MGNLVDTLFQFRHITTVSSILFFLIIGTAFFLIYQDSRLMREQIYNDFNQQQLILARQAAAKIDDILHDVAVEIEELSSLSGSLPPSARSTVYEAAFRRLQTKGVLTIGWLDHTGVIQEQFGLQKTVSPAVLKSVREMQEKGESSLFLSGMSINTTEAENKTILSTVCAPAPNGEGNIFFAVLDITDLVARVTQDIHSGKTGYAWVITETGMFLFHPEKEFIGKNAFTARHERKPYVSFSKINEIMKNRMLQGKEGTGTYVSGWHRGLSGEITKLIAYTPIRSTLLPTGKAWSVAVVAPISEVAEAVSQVYVRLFWTGVALVAGLFIYGMLAVMYHRRLSQSLKVRVNLQQEYMSSLLANSMDAIVFIDNDNRIQVWNRGAEAIFGYTAEEMLGQSFHRLIPPEVDAEKELERIRNEVYVKGHVRHYLARRITKDGRRITIDLSRTLLRDQNGEPIGSTAIMRDVTEKMEIEQRIYNTEKLASIGILAAGIAHEINNPLAIILGFTDLLLEKADPDSSEYEDLKIIEFNANHAKKVVEDMLGFARVTEGLEDHVDVPASIKTVVGICKNTLMTKKIELKLDVPEQLPLVRGDTREFQQVIFNLINNAIAAMAPEKGTLTITAKEEGDQVKVNVTDTGIGIPDKIKPQIFDPFFTTKKAGEGTGLGLSLCYGIVKKYGGTITFTSVSAEDDPSRPSGTTFTVTMPVYHEEEVRQGGKG